MLFSELVSNVITLTNRPDFEAEIKVHLLKATSKLHLADFWFRDRRVDYYTFNTAAYIQTLSIAEVFSRWRAWSFLRKYNPNGTDPQTQLQTGVGRYPLIEILEPQELFNEYFSSKTDVAYAAGDTLTIRSSDPLKYLLVGWYQAPILSTDDAVYSSWIADAHPYAIIDEAICAVFRSIGYDEQERKYAQYTAEHLQLLRTNNTTPEGW